MKKFMNKRVFNKLMMLLLVFSVSFLFMDNVKAYWSNTCTYASYNDDTTACYKIFTSGSIDTTNLTNSSLNSYGYVGSTKYSNFSCSNITIPSSSLDSYKSRLSDNGSNVSNSIVYSCSNYFQYFTCPDEAMAYNGTVYFCSSGTCPNYNYDFYGYYVSGGYSTSSTAYTCKPTSSSTNSSDNDSSDDVSSSNSSSSNSSSNSSSSSSSSSKNTNGSSYSVTYGSSSSKTCDDLTVWANKSTWSGTEAGILSVYNSDGDLITFGSNSTTSEPQYTFYSSASTSSTKYTAYCRNAGVSSKLTTSWTQLQCNRKLLTTTGQEAMDAGIIAIIESSGSYYAIMSAIRAYLYYFPEANDNNWSWPSSNYKYWNYSYAKMAVDIAESSEVSNLISQLSKAGVNVTTNISYGGVAYFYTTNYANIESTVPSLVITGLQAALNYATNGSTDDEIMFIIDDPKYKNYTDTNGKYVSTITYDFEYTGYSSEDKVILDFECSNCSKYGVSYTLYVDGEKINSDTYTLTIDDSNTSGSIELEIEFTADSNYNCSKKVSYSLDVTHPSSDAGASVYDVSVGDSTQHFYIYVNNNSAAGDGDETDEITDSVSICDMSCEEVKEACDQGDSDACDTYNNTYGGTCVECTTYVSNATCSVSGTSGTTLEIKEGTEGSTDLCSITSDLNVLQCIIDKKDLTDENEYKVTSGSSYSNVLDNKYCSVYCREEYRIELPGVKAVNSGRYFTLSVTIDGEKDCYTSEIDSDTFETDELAARTALVNAYNAWIRIKTIYDAYNNATTIQNMQYYYSQSEYWSMYMWYNNGYYCSQDYYNYIYYDYKYIYEFYYTRDINGNYIGNYAIDTFGSVDVSYNYTNNASCAVYNGYTVTTPDEAFNNKYSGGYGTVENNLAHKEKALQDAISAYLEIINKYNACTGSSVYTYTDTKDYSISGQSLSSTAGWNMEYTFNPSISFWYEETSYLDNSSVSTTLDTKGSASTTYKGETVFTCDEIYDDYSACKSGSNGEVFTKTTKFLCYSTGDGYTCGSKDVYISNATYVKQEYSSHGDYITPTQFYTIYASGSIVIAGENAAIDNASVIENGLPVGLGTVSGVYNYVLQVSDLGEYYNGSTDLGRIWGADKSVVTAAIDKYEACYTDFALADADSASSLSNEINSTILDLNAGVYVCAYKVSCPDCPVECDPVCGTYDFDCPDCDPECPDCVYTNKINYSYRTITTSDTDPNDRGLGSNWYTGTNIQSAVENNTITTINSELQLKAYVTSIEIYEDGESIYDVKNGENVSTKDINNDYVLTVTMDSQLTSWIQDYNNSAGSGGYATSSDGKSSTLKCYDYTSNDGSTEKNIFCYSTFIDEIIYAGYGSKLSGISERVIGEDADSTDAKREVSTQSSGYWTTWDTGNWYVTTNYTLNTSVGDYTSGVGPSWK